MPEGTNKLNGRATMRLVIAASLAITLSGCSSLLTCQTYTYDVETPITAAVLSTPKENDAKEDKKLTVTGTACKGEDGNWRAYPEVPFLRGLFDAIGKF